MRRIFPLALAFAGCASSTSVSKPPDRAAVHKISALASTRVFPASPSDDCTETKQSFEQPIKIVEDLGIERHPSILGFPIAFSRAADVHSLSGFYAATPDGEPLP